MTAVSSEKLTNNYRRYMQLHYLARKTKGEGMPQPEILESINEASKQMTDFEKKYAEWVCALYAKNINIEEIKRQIKILAKYQAALNAAQKATKDGITPTVEITEELESCKPKELTRRWWCKTTRFTQLCALRAAMRGRSHFAPTTKESTLSSYGISRAGVDAQMHWVESCAEEFCK